MKIKYLLNHYLKADTRYTIHSPFVFDLMEEVFESERTYYDFRRIESCRQQLLSSNKTIQVTDLGAGSRRLKKSERAISEIAKTALSRPAKCSTIFKLIEHLQLKNRLELGTSLGIMSLYMYGPYKKSGHFITLEGCPETWQFANNLHHRLNANIDHRLGNFDDTIGNALNDLKTLDCAYIDGNHTIEATINYVEQCIPFMTHQSVLILDDIFWSEGMYKAWNQCRSMSCFTLSLTIQGLGLLFKNDQFLQKQHFDVIPYRYKPWKFDLF